MSYIKICQTLSDTVRNFQYQILLMESMILPILRTTTWEILYTTNNLVNVSVICCLKYEIITFLMVCNSV